MIQLNRYLLRTICSDLFNFLIRYFAKENGVEMPATLTVQVSYVILHNHSQTLPPRTDA